MKLYRSILLLSVVSALGLSVPVLADEVPAEFPDINIMDHERGAKNPQVTIIVYEDFQCPFCQRHEPNVQKILSLYKGKVSMVYRPFPLDFHEYAMPFAIAAECVSRVKDEAAFWRFYTIAFRKVPTLRTYNERIALRLGENMSGNAKKFDACYKDKDITTLIRSKMAQGEQAGVTGTPATFIVDRSSGKYELVAGAVPLETLTDVIDEMLNGTWKK